MKPVLVVLMGMALLLGGCINNDDHNPDERIPGAGIEDYADGDPAEPHIKMWEAFDIPFADADKTGNNDSQLCWAAAVANMLAWTGWSEDESTTLDLFRYHFDDQPGYLYDALQYYFNDFVPDVQADMVTVRESRSERLLEFLAGALHEGKGAVVKIAYPDRKIGHFVTIYGYWEEKQPETYRLYYTDSDDYVFRMKDMQVTWNETSTRWDINSIYQGWYLEYVVTLAGPHQR